MIWLIAVACLAIGVVIGFMIAGRAQSTPTKISDLETRLEELQNSNTRYRDEVSNHFSMTAELVQQMTDSYRDVYQHLATGAQELCSGEVAAKLLPASSDTVPGTPPTPVAEPEDKKKDQEGVQAPKDYAPRAEPGQGGALAEDFGLEKAKETEKEFE